MLKKQLSLLAAALLLAACGGGGGSGSASSGDSNTGVVTPPKVPTLDEKIATAMQTGDTSGLDPATAQPSLLQKALVIAGNVQQQQVTLLGSILRKNGTDLDQSLTYTGNSIAVYPQNSTSAVGFLNADGNNGMAAFSVVGKGRGLAYGADVLSWMAGTSNQQQHLPLFQRVMTWLVTGNPDAAMPATVKFTVAGYGAANVNNFFKKSGWQAQEVSCDLTDLANTCWQNTDLMVFGGGTKDVAGLSAQIQTYLNAGKSVVYFAPSWIESGGGRKVANAMGIDIGGYPGNYFASADDLKISNTRTAADTISRADKMAGLIGTIQKLQTDQLLWDFAADSSPLDPVTLVMNEINGIQGRGVNLFSGTNMDLHKLLVLWADLWRPSVTKYGQLPPEQKSTAPDFLRTFASDSWVVFNREKTTIAPNGYGDFMPKEAITMPVSGDFESIDVTIAQSSGITAIGRAAVPGKPVTIRIVDAAGGSLGVQSGFARTWGNPVSDGKKYARPRKPISPNIPLSATDNVFVTPFGGPLYLNYSGMTPGTVVRLSIKGSARYAHFDFTKDMPQADIDAAVALLKSKVFGWQTAKFIGGEVHQTNAYALSVIGNNDPKTYVMDNLRRRIFDSNHIANGYSDMPMSDNVKNVCAQLGWVCDGDMHRAPVVQHIVGWIATCGFLCSGNPIDGFAGIDAGWGYWHEMGHNTVQRIHHIVPPGTAGCVVECDNNILSSASALRQYGISGIDVSGDRIDHKGLYGYITASRATGKTGTDLIADMSDKLWNSDNQNAKRAIHFQLGFLFTKFRLGMNNPTALTTIDFLTLLTKGDRLVAKNWTAANANLYAMGRYNNNTITNHDLLYVLSSTIIGQDLRAYFAAWGIPLDQRSLDSVSDLKLPVAPLLLYALAPGNGNKVETGSWVNIDGKTPAYPY
jgi:hypothetical protein